MNHESMQQRQGIANKTLKYTCPRQALKTRDHLSKVEEIWTCYKPSDKYPHNCQSHAYFADIDRRRATTFRPGLYQYTHPRSKASRSNLLTSIDNLALTS